MCYCRDGRLRVGDELIKVNGRRMRGLTLQEARSTLRTSPHQVEIVIARLPGSAPAPLTEEETVTPADTRQPDDGELPSQPQFKDDEAHPGVSSALSPASTPAATATETGKVTGMRKFSYRTEQVSLSCYTNS